MNILSCNKNTSFYGTYKGTVKINELNTNSIESRDAYVVQMDPKDKKQYRLRNFPSHATSSSTSL